MSHLICSVVLASHELTQAFYDSVESALNALAFCQEPGECVVVLDGRPNEDRDAVLNHFIDISQHLRVHCVSPGGLTRALIHGCALARGLFIARLDVGDAMTSNRLVEQITALRADSHCVLATSDVDFCGPLWEPLWTNRGRKSHAGVPIRVDRVPVSEGIAMDIPHHSSVMFRRDVYLSVGGYRSQFYFGQDWDLWYRLAAAGTFIHVPKVLTRVRLSTDGLSSRHWREQREIARLSLACYQARYQGETEVHFLQLAAAVRPRPRSKSHAPWDGRRADGAYFIAEALRRNGDLRCFRYFPKAVLNGFWKPRIWFRFVQSLTLILRAI